MTARVFQPGDRVEFDLTRELLGKTQVAKTYRGVVEGASKDLKVYFVIHDGEQKSRPVSADRLRKSPPRLYSVQGNDVA